MRSHVVVNNGVKIRFIIKEHEIIIFQFDIDLIYINSSVITPARGRIVSPAPPKLKMVE